MNALDSYEVSQFPELDRAQVSSRYMEIAIALFGEDAVGSDPQFMKEPVRVFVEQIMVNEWARFRKGFKRESRWLQTLREEVEFRWKGMLSITSLLLE